jgi:hypothetical protein
VARAVLGQTGDDHGANDLRRILEDYSPDADASEREAAATAAADWLRSSGLPDRS